MNGLSERPLGEREAGIAYSAAAVLPLFFSLIFALIAPAVSPDYENEGCIRWALIRVRSWLFSRWLRACALLRGKAPQRRSDFAAVT